MLSATLDLIGSCFSQYCGLWDPQCTSVSNFNTIGNARLNRRSQDFLCGGCTFLLTKNLLSPVITLSYIVTYVIPFDIICGGCTSPNSPPFSPHSNKKPNKIFRHLGVRLHPLATPMHGRLTDGEQIFTAHF